MSKWNISNKKCGNRDKNAFYGFISRHKVAEEGISEFNDRLTEITQIETQKGKKKESGKQSEESTHEICGISV